VQAAFYPISLSWVAAQNPATFSTIYHYGILCCLSVLNHGEGVCLDPVKGDATLGVGGPRPPGRVSEHQLIPDREGGRT
jgi:hypothetical protein